MISVVVLGLEVGGVVDALDGAASSTGVLVVLTGVGPLIRKFWKISGVRSYQVVRSWVGCA